MVFQHTKALPKLMSELPQVPISGIGVSGFRGAKKIRICRPLWLG